MAVRRMLFVPLMTLVVACTLVARSAHPVVTHAKSIVPREEMRPCYPSLDVSGYSAIGDVIEPWRADATLQEIARHWRGVGTRGIDLVDEELTGRVNPALPTSGWRRKGLRFSSMTGTRLVLTKHLANSGRSSNPTRGQPASRWQP